MNNHKIRVACLQLEARPFLKEAKNKEHILQFIIKAARLKPDLIILPECVYPCYFLSPRIIPDYRVLTALTNQFLDEVKEYARKYQIYIALGLPEFIPEKNLLYNSAALINDKGQEIGRVRKSFLWHFDNKWFQSDNNYPVFDTKIGRIGLFICADGRLPEITRCLSLQGAEVLLDLTNWVTSGLERKAWSNPQAEYMIPTRALENKVWIVAANKIGYEEKSIQYCGKSAFFSPDGETVIMASSDQEEILLREIDLSLSHQKNIAGLIDVFQSRKPEQYNYLALPTSELPISKDSKKQSNKKTENYFAAVIQIGGSADEEFSAYLSRMEYFFHTLTDQEVSLLSFSQHNFLPVHKSPVVLDLLQELTKKSSVLCSIVLKEQKNSLRYKTSFLVQSGKIIGKYRKTHLELPEKDKINPGENYFPVFETQFGTIGMMLDYEGYFPEIARILTLKGAEIIIWASQFGYDEHLKICQTRSAENKIFIICPNSIQQEYNGHSIITAPSGQIVTGCLQNQEVASMASIFLSLARDKTIVPHTKAILGRQPESYQLLTS
ncbi:MAG: carbon-nitrogen hydrolase family protein [Atribacterota bacterium]|nr:carbon-nitrogen hydrolase family protein [Atribacterota bacterium]MDD5636797.1 carbon-nitrogen hydrolase family protein [Atribacterota bacterium]